MSTLKMTKGSIDRIQAPDPSGKQALYWDTETRGFGLLVSGKTNAKTYICQRRLGDSRQLRRLTIGQIGEFARVEDARREAGELLHGLRNGKDPKAERRKAVERDRKAIEHDKTLGHWLDTYLGARKDLRERSVSTYRRTAERYIAHWLNKPLRAITPDMIEAQHNDIGKNRGEASANTTMRVFRLLHNFARERDNTLPENPTKRLKKAWFKIEARTSMVRSDQMPAFYKAVDALPSRTARDYLLLLLFTGLRRGEAASLRWDDIDFGLRVIRLPAATTKSGRKLDLPMSSFVRDLLVARRAIGRDGPYVFAGDGQSGHMAEPRHPLEQVAKATGIVVTAHDLRRTYVTTAESTDISPMALKALVNHSLGKDVTSGYVQMTVERLRELAQRVSDRLMALCEIGVDVPEGITRLGAAQ